MSSSTPDSDKTTTSSKKSAFDALAASRLVTELRGNFASGKTRSYEWRLLQLNAIAKLVVDHEQEIVDALRNDLGKPPLETVAYEVSSFTLLLVCVLFIYIYSWFDYGSGKGIFQKIENRWIL